jgi:diadenosine tetraphosphate (Ap4A) HIT family hydrolase
MLESPDGFGGAYRLSVSASAWSDPASWAKQRRPESCPICIRGVPLDVLADFPATWITGGASAPLPGYACVVSKHHVVEPFELPVVASAAFWGDVMLAAAVVNRLFSPAKINYEIHGNTIPHLHLHLFPRFAGDPYEGGPIDPRRTGFQRSAGDLDRLRRELAQALRGSQTTG